MPATQHGRAAAAVKDLSPGDLGWNAVSVPPSTTTLGNTVSVRGLDRLALVITVAGTSPNITWSIAARIQGTSAGSGLTRAFGTLATALQANLAAAGTYVYMLDLCADEITVQVQNNSGANAATITIAISAKPIGGGA